MDSSSFFPLYGIDNTSCVLLADLKLSHFLASFRYIERGSERTFSQRRSSIWMRRWADQFLCASRINDFCSSSPAPMAKNWGSVLTAADRFHFLDFTEP